MAEGGGKPAESAMETLSAALAGQRRAIARLISLAEVPADKAADEVKAVLAEVYRRAGAAHVLGITGPPGAGKSTLVTALTRCLRARGRTVGIVAIDPSSPFSGGAILGDRVRMAELGGDDGVFIRSLATQGALGGLARPALDTADVMDACGFEVIIIETVGVGQDEVDIAEAAHTVLVASPPGLGDGIQAMKAGLLETADIHVVTKADRPGADRMAADLSGSLDIGLSGKDRGSWQVPVLLTSAEAGTGIDVLADAVAAHADHLRASGGLAARARRIADLRLRTVLADRLRRFLSGELSGETGGEVEDLTRRLTARETDPAAAADRILTLFAKRIRPRGS